MNWINRDKKHLWHPITQHKTAVQPLYIKKASGIYLYDEEENSYIDSFSSWYTCIYGHNHPEIIKSVIAQYQKLDHVVFAGLTHEAAILFSEALMEILPVNQQKIFFSDNGSTAVEVAIKMALQFYHNKGALRNQIIALEGAFHGDTFAAMAVSNQAVYHGAFERHLLTVRRIPVPNEANFEQVYQQLEQLLQESPSVCFIYEPLVQGANCMKMYDSSHLEKLIQLVKSYGVLNIADEVMTGFGKTGSYFASDYMPTKPDIICLAKALTAGAMPLAVTTCTNEVYEAFYDEDLTKGFFHGHTYSAHPVACSAAHASIRLLQSNIMQENIKRISFQHLQFAEKLKKFPQVEQIRTLGVIIAFELKINGSRYGKQRDKLYQQLLQLGIFARPLGHTIYLLPPYIITDEELTYLYQQLLKLLN